MKSFLKNQKAEITEYVATQEGVSTDDQSLKKLNSTIWLNPRKKEIGGLRLTEKGFEVLSRHFRSHLVRFEETRNGIKFTNKLTLQLDNFITCPWYINNKGVFVFDDKMAIQLVLFSGDIEKYASAKAKSLDNSAK